MLSPWILAAVTFAQAGGTTPEWKPFTSTKGKFTVSMPAKPTEKRRVLAISGKTVDLVSMTARKGLATYTTAYAEVSASDSAAAIKVAQADLLAQSRGELKEEKEIALGEFPGKELVIDIPKKVIAGGATESARVYVVGGRLYELIAVVPAAKAESLVDEVNSFFDSFKATGTPPAATDTVPKPKAEVAKAATSKAAAPKTAAPPPLPPNPGGVLLNGLTAMNPFAGRASARVNPPVVKPSETNRVIEFKDPEGKFSVTAPDKLIAQELPPPPGAPAGTKVTAKRYQLVSAGKIFTLLASDIPEKEAAGIPPSDFLGKMRDGGVKAGRGVLVRERLVSRDGLQGIEFVFTSPRADPPKGGVVIGLVFVDVQAKRLYTLSVSGPVGTDNEKGVKDFLDSFHLLPGPSTR